MSEQFVTNQVYAYDLYRQIGENTKNHLDFAITMLKSDGNSIRILNIIAYGHYYNNDFYNALDYGLRAYNLDYEPTTPDELYYTCNLLGNIYRYIGANDSAIHYYMAALNLNPSYHSQEKRCTALRYLAITYTEMNMTKYAIDYAIEALQLAELIHDNKLVSDVHVALCSIYYKIKAYKKGLRLYPDSIKFYTESNDKKGLIRAYIVAGNLHNATNNIHQAKSYYKIALQLSENINYTFGLVDANHALGCLLIIQKNYISARTFLNDALAIARRYNIQGPRIKIYYALSEVYIKENNYKQAFNLYKMATELKEDLTSKQYNESIFKYHSDYTLEQKEAQIRNYLEQNRSLKKANKQLIEQVKHDPLTKLYNRRGLRTIIDSYDNSGKHSLTLCDIDKFKNINDTYGHQCGDYILIELSKLLLNSCHTSFKISRWGGEEFLILMPNTSVDEATVFANQIREDIANYTFVYRRNKINLTMTFGISGLVNNFELSVDNADNNLYRGKKSGRNKVISTSMVHSL